MATQVFLHDTGGGTDVTVAGHHLATNTAKLNGSTSGWTTKYARHNTRGGSANTISASTVAGTTPGVEVVQTNPCEWITLPIDQDVTISGAITFNIWATENNMSANVAINCKIERISGATGAVVSTIITTARTTEVAVTTPAVNNFTGTPTSTNMLKGDRFRITLFGDDAGTMASGFTFDVRVGGATAGASGDTYVSFNETFGFQTSYGAGTTLYLTDNAGPAVGANDEKEMWTTAGGGTATTAVVNTTSGWTAPIQFTKTAGGTAIEWYSRRLQAFTLDGLVFCQFRMHESNIAANAGFTVELAICDSDGGNAVAWGTCTPIDSASPGGTVGSGGFDGELSNASSTWDFWIAGAATAVADGKRLRIRVFANDSAANPMVTGHTLTLTYGANSGVPADGASTLVLPQTVSEYVPVPIQQPPPRVNRLRHMLVR